MGSVRDRRPAPKRPPMLNMHIPPTSAATSGEAGLTRTSGGVQPSGQHQQQQTSSRSAAGAGASVGVSNPDNRSQNAIASSNEHQASEASNRKSTRSAETVNKVEQHSSEPLKPPPRRKSKTAIAAGGTARKTKSTESAEPDSSRQETTPSVVDVSATSGRTGNGCAVNKSDSTNTGAADCLRQRNDNSSHQSTTTTTSETNCSRSDQPPQKNSILKKSSKPQSESSTSTGTGSQQRQQLNSQQRVRHSDPVDSTGTSSPRRVLFKSNVSVYRFDVESNSVILEDQCYVDRDRIRRTGNRADHNTATTSHSVPSSVAVPRPHHMTTTMQELLNDDEKVQISRLNVTHQPLAPKGRLITDKFPPLTNGNVRLPTSGYGQDQKQTWWQYEADEHFPTGGSSRGRPRSYSSTLSSAGDYAEDESNRKTIFLVLASSAPLATEGGSLQTVSNSAGDGRKPNTSSNDAADFNAATTSYDVDYANSNEHQQQLHLLRRQGVTNRLSSDRESLPTMEPLHHSVNSRRLLIAFKLPTNEADGGQPFTADSLLVKANRDGCRVRVVSMTSPRSPSRGVQQQRGQQGSVDPSRVTPGSLEPTDADYQLNEQLNLPYTVDPYRVVARLEPDSTLVIEAPIVEPS